MKIFLMALMGLSLAGAQAQAGPYITLEGGRSEDYRLLGLSGGGPVDTDGHFTLQGSLAQSRSVFSDGTQVHAGELGAGIGFDDLSNFYLGLDGLGGRNSDEVRHAGATASLGIYGEGGSFDGELGVYGGAMHYLFAPEQSLRQNSVGGVVRLGLMEKVSFGVSGTVYLYDRDLIRRSANGTGGGGSTGPGGFFGLLGPGPSLPGGGIGGAAGAEQAGGPLVTGFPRRDWSGGITVKPLLDSKLGADYTQTELMEDGSWVKVLGAFWRQELSETFSTLFSWNKAVEGGSDSPFFKLSLTWTFGSDKAI